MDLTALRAALRIYTPTYRAHATQLAAPPLSRQWMESMPDWQTATRDELEAHAVESARWASAGYRPAEGIPLRAAGMTPELASAADPQTDQERLEYLASRMDLLDG